MPTDQSDPVANTPANTSFLDRFFGISAQGSSIRTEIIGGITTFVTMAYIIVVNPAILEVAGIPVGPSTIATILACILGTFLMGLYAKRPIAVAPYMGENAFIAFAMMGVSFQQRLGSVFVSGVIFLILTVFGLRTWLADAISKSMKHSFAVGIGLFLCLVAIFQTGIITHGLEGMPRQALTFKNDVLQSPSNPPVPPVKVGDFTNTRVQLAIAGFILIVTLMYWRIPGGILLGIAIIGTVGYFLGEGNAPKAIIGLPNFFGAGGLSEIAFQLDIPGVLTLDFFPILLTLFLICFLDTLGTLMAVGSAGNMLDDRGNFPDIKKPMMVDSLSCMFSALIGTSTSGAYIESVTGVREGARTGLAAVITALLFAVSLFFIPLLQPLQTLAYSYSPALLAVGVLMVNSFKHIDFDDMTEAVPALTTIVMMLFTFNIANGLTAGLVMYPVFRILTGRWHELSVGGVLLGLACLSYFAFGVLH